MERAVDPRDLEEVRALLRREKAALIMKYHAEGVAIGRGSSPDSYAIVVYLSAARPELGDTELDGVPLRFEVTGKFHPQ